MIIVQSTAQGSAATRFYVRQNDYFREFDVSTCGKTLIRAAKHLQRDTRRPHMRQTGQNTILLWQCTPSTVMSCFTSIGQFALVVVYIGKRWGPKSGSIGPVHYHGATDDYTTIEEDLQIHQMNVFIILSDIV